MKNRDFFKENKYCLVEGALSKETLSISTQYMLFEEKNNFSPEPYMEIEGWVGRGAHGKYCGYLTESILMHLLPTVEENTGLELIPTYSYYRIYRSGHDLVPHKDKDACEISVTMTIGHNYPPGYEGWPIFIEDSGFIADPGDMIIYRGNELYHHRNPFDVDSDIQKNYFQCQTFLHYVDKNGPHKNLAFDQRKEVGVAKRATKVY
jgi:hypothetical protein